MSLGQGRLVLVVEDSPADQEIIRRASLSSDEKCELAMVLDGESALAMLEAKDGDARQLPDLILLDLNLPNLSGREVLERIRGTPTLRHIPVVILTTTQSPREILECYRSGANSFVTKPAAFQDFVQLIRGICQYWFSLVRLPMDGASEAEAESRSRSLG